MKRILIILLQILNCVTAQTLVLNDTTFFVSVTNESSNYNSPESPSVCVSTNKGRVLFNNISIGSKATGTGIIALNCNFQSSAIVFDTKRPIVLQNIMMIGDWYSGTVPFTITVESASSSLGPWVVVGSKQVNSVSLTAGGYSAIDLGGMPNIKISRYWRITIPTFNANYGGTAPLRQILYEIKLYESSLITSSLPFPLLNGQCTNLTATAGETYLWSTGATTRSINVCKAGTYTCQVTNTSFTGNQDHVATIAVSTLGEQDNWVGPNGEVHSIYRNGNTVYYGGNFDAVGPATGSGALIDSLGLPNINFPRVDGVIRSVISDGLGGWYIGGSFTRVGNYTSVSNLAHINANGSVDINFNPIPNGAVNSLILSGANLYVGGEFTTIKGLANNYFAKVDKTTGAPIFLNAGCNNIIRSMSLYGDKIIIGGNFTTLGGATRNYLGAVDTVFIQASTWNPNPNGAVFKVFVNGTKLYVGGDFTNISSVAKSRGAGYSLPAFTLDGYDFGANARILDFTFLNSVLYAAGEFTTIGGAARNYVVGLNPLNALANGFNATANGIVRAISVYNGNIFAGGDFSSIGGASRSRIALLNPITGSANAWNPGINGLKGSAFNVNALAVSANGTYAGGSFWGVGTQGRNNVAAVDATTGQLLPFNANANNIVRAIYADINAVYLGGDFTTVNGSVLKNRIAQVNATTGVATGWNPNADGVVTSLAVSGTNLFVGGAFANIGGAARNRIASLTIGTGAATTFNPNANGAVNSLTISGDTLAVGGAFTTIGGQTRNRVALYGITSNTLLGANPNVNNTVNALAINGNKLYIGGSFTAVGASIIQSFAEYNLSTNTVTNLNTALSLNARLYALAAADSSVYLGGGLSYPNQGQPINNLATVKTLSNKIGYWMPQPNDTIRSIFLSADKAYVGGRFTLFQNRYQPFFATADLYNSGNPPTITSLSAISVCVNGTITVTGSGFKDVKSVKIGATDMPFVVNSLSSITITVGSSVTGTVRVSNILGDAISSQSITVVPPPIASITAVGSMSFCQGSSVVLNANTGTGFTYAWRRNDTIISGATASNYTVTSAGSYTVRISNSSNCSAISNTLIATVNARPSIVTTTPGSVCGTGTANIGAIASAGNINWYSAAIGGTSIGTGTSFITPSIATTTTYYTDATVNGCTTATRTAVAATVNLIPNISANTPASRCGIGTVTLAATASTGTINWYSAVTGGISIGTGISFTTPSISATTTYYVDATANGCTTATRIAIAATVNAVPTITANTPASRCGTGTVNLGATASAGIINWYSAATGGASLGTGTSFTTPSISTTTTYYVDAVANGCTTATRTAVTATVNTVPTITSSIPASRCGTGTISLSAIASAGTINWYGAATGGTALGTGTSFTTPSISTTTTYYVDALNNGCTAATRTAVTATVNTAPTITSSIPASRCGTGTISLSAIASAGAINWYGSATGGTSLGTGASYNTPSISTTTTYYVDATANGCTTVTRSAVTATINVIPTITSSVDGSRCGTGTISLSAIASAGIINWYGVSTGGTSLGTGTSFTTPSLLSTTNYYVDATSNGCTTPTRILVVANVNNTPPTITSTLPGNRCGIGTVILQATPSSGTVSWYASATGGTALATGNTFTTPTISTNTTYYADVVANGCVASSRTPVTATINTAPTITSTTNGSRCGSGTVTLQAAVGSGTINWYSTSTGGTSIGTGLSYTTPTISNTTTYYVDATLNGCTTPTRSAVAATVNTSPTITSTTDGSRCGTGIVTLQAAASSGTINWFTTSTGGTSIASGGLITTPTLNTPTNYYVEATDGVCSSDARTLVRAAINEIPVIGLIAGPTTGLKVNTNYNYIVSQQANSTFNWAATNGVVLSGQGTNSVDIRWVAEGNGKVTLVVTNTSGCRDTSNLNVMVVLNTPQINSFTPQSGTNGSTITIIGDNFNGTTSVRFGGVKAKSFNVVSSSVITAVVDTGSTGAVSIENPNGNASLVGFIYIPSTGLSNYFSDKVLHVYPNPTKELLTIDFRNTQIQGNVKLQIHDVLGRLVFDELLNEQSLNEHTISVSGLSTGNYILTLKTNDKIEHIKFVKE